jgi:outer membrane lipoprotein carrier protein
MLRLTASLLVGSSLALVLVSNAALDAQTAQPDAADLAQRLQARYQTVHDFTANFTQTYQGVLLRQKRTESGTLAIKKPNRLRFEYTQPEKKTFVSNGVVFRSYIPADKLATEDPLPKDNEQSTALLFLAGRGNLVRDFQASLPASQPAGEWHLLLTPKAKQADFQTLTLIVDRASLALRGFTTVDDQGTSTIRLSNLKENTGVKDDVFAYEFPKGVQIRR